MHNYLFDTELVRLAILLSVVISMLFYSRYGVTTGGAIVPGYLALFMAEPTHIAITLLFATLTYQIVQKQLRPRFMLWGRRLFEVEMIVALSLQCLWVALLVFFRPYAPAVTLLYGIGFLLPGIIAHDMGRQGVRATIGAALICALVIFGLVTIIGATRDILGLPHQLGPLLYHASVVTYAYPSTWLLIGVIISVLISIALFHFRLFDTKSLTDALRTGGFVTAAYMALFINRPLDILFVVICSSLTYLIVTRLLMRQAILFGRSKMAAMFLCAMVITWVIEIAIFSIGFAYTPWVGFNAITPTIIALLANDSHRQGLPRTLLGVAISTLTVFTFVSLIYWGYQSI